MSNLAHSSILNIQIIINGNNIDDRFAIQSCSVKKAINKVSLANVVIAVGLDTPANDLSVFAPGAEIEIKAGYDMQASSIFKGIITGQRVKGKTKSELHLICSDKSIKMTVGRKNRFFTDETDDNIVSKLASENALGVEAGSTEIKHSNIIQHNATDWDFAVARAAANGFVITNKDGVIKFDKPSLSSKAVLKIVYGEDLIDFDLMVNSQNQMLDIVSKSWDVKEQRLIEVKAMEPSINEHGSLTVEKLAEVLKISDFQLPTSTSVQKEQLERTANAALLRTRLSRISGTIDFWGNASVDPDTLITIENLGDLYDGDAYVSEVEHTMETGNWQTKATIGLDADLYASQNTALSNSKRSNFLPGIEGLQVGTVKKIESDQDEEVKILVHMPLIDSSENEVWARISNFYASANAGSFFLPEVDDEVVLGFINGDPHSAVVLRMMYNPKNKAPFQVEEENNTKAIVTKNQLKITFEDKDKQIIVETPKGNKITLSDKDDSVELVDSNNNKVLLNKEGIRLDSAKDIVLTAKGNIKIDATAGIKMDAKADVVIDALNINNQAKVGFEAKGNAKAELSASGQTIVKGAMVMIN